MVAEWLCLKLISNRISKPLVFRIAGEGEGGVGVLFLDFFFFFACIIKPGKLYGNRHIKPHRGASTHSFIHLFALNSTSVTQATENKPVRLGDAFVI